MRENYFDLELGENLKIVHRSRKSNRGRNAGGGIAIIYNTQKIRLSEFTFKRGRSELVCATGKIPNNPRKIAIIGAYVPPKNTAKQDKEMFEQLSNLIL